MNRIHLEAIKRNTKYLGFAVIASILLNVTSIGTLYAAEPVQTALDENDFLIFGVQIIKDRIPREVTGYRYKDGYVISLQEFVSSLEFAIEVNPQKGTAAGWFISEDRQFTLDYAKRRVIVDDRKLPLSLKEIFFHNDELYVSMAALSSWFAIELVPNIRDLILVVTPAEQLPIQKRLAREKARASATHQSVNPVTRPYKEIPYQAYSAPVVDLGFSYSTINRDEYDPIINYSYNMNAIGDLGYMTGHVQAAGSKSDSLNYLKFDMERVDFDDGMLLGANVIRFGDIRTASLASGSGGSFEKGIFLQRSQGISRGLHDTVDIYGVLLDGWEVELYRDGLFLGYFSDSGDGRFIFEGIELLYGMNQFELVFYGPNGQVERETRNHYVGEQMLRSLEVGYSLSITEKESSLFDVSDTPNTSSTTNLGSTRLVGNIDLGLTKAFTASLGSHSVEFYDQRHNYTTYGLRASLNNLFVSVSRTDDDLSGFQDSYLLQSYLAGWRLRASHTKYNGLITEGSINNTDPPKYHSALTLYHRFDKVPVSFSLSDTESQLTNSTTLSNTIGYSAGRTSYSNTLNYRVVNDQNEQNDSTSGDINFSTNQYYPLTLRGRLSYGLSPESKINEYFIGSQLSPNKKLRMKFDITHSTPGTEETTMFKAGLTWVFPNFFLTASLSTDSNDTYTGFVNLSSSLNKHNPEKDWKADNLASSGYGSVLTRVYIDNNGDGNFNTGDTLYSGAKVKAVQASKKATTDQNGIAVLTRLQSYQKVDIEIEKASLGDASLVPASEGNSILPRPGFMGELDIPLVWAGEVEGTLYQRTKEGIESPLASTRLFLVNSDGLEVLSAITAFDGYYLFPEVLPGVYRLALAKDSSRSILEGSGLIEARGDGSVLGVENVVVSSTRKTAEENFLFSTESNSATSVPFSQPVIAHEIEDDEPIRQPAIIAQDEVDKPAHQPAIIYKDEVKDKPAVKHPSLTLQLAAFSSEEKAKSGLDRLVSKHARTLSAYQIDIVPTSDRLYKLRIKISGGMSQARNACENLKRSGIDCFVLR